MKKAIIVFITLSVMFILAACGSEEPAAEVVQPVAPITGTTLTAVFGGNNDFSGDSGCNTFSGGYTASGGGISIGPLATTQKTCQEEVNAQEQEYLAALRSVTSYLISGSQLILYSGGSEAVRFNRIG